MTFKIFQHKVSKKGTSLIFIIQPGTYKVSTGYHCKVGSWDQRSQQVLATGQKKDPKAPQINSKLRKASIFLQELIDEGLDINSIRIKYDGRLNKIVNTPEINRSDYSELSQIGRQFYLLVENIIHSHKSDWSDGYKGRFRAVRSKILWYEPNFRIEMLDEEWWRGFVTYCIEDLGNISNTIDTDSRTLKALCKELRIDARFKWGYIEPEVKGLSWDKVLKIETVDLIGTGLEDSRMLWMVAVYTGRRRSEVYGITSANFYFDKRWRYRNIGKGNKLIDIPLLKEAVLYLTKIGLIGGNKKLPTVPFSQVNLDIKQICKLAGFNDPVLVIKPISPSEVHKEIKKEWQTVRFHTARHSYGQHLVELAAGRPHSEKWIAWRLGHASFQTTWKYINRSASSNEALDEEISNST